MHFDAQVGSRFVEHARNPKFVAKHSWSPLISYAKQEKRYKPQNNKTIYKTRNIMYASHRDACIFSWYAAQLTSYLEKYYRSMGLDQSVLAYRSLGKSNYHFSAEAQAFARSRAPCVVLSFDVTGFFDALDHNILKRRLKECLDVESLSQDWYQVFKTVTRYRHIPRSTLLMHPTFAERMRKRLKRPIATMFELNAEGIVIQTNLQLYGIPQGTPISAALSNLYMLDCDQRMVEICKDHDAFYKRYSDDILIICSIESEEALCNALKSALADHELEIKQEKYERMQFDESTSGSFQYLGFNISRSGAVIRPSSLARQWRKAKRAIKKTREAGSLAIAAGKAQKIYTKRLRRRFSPIGARNFSSYARRAASLMGGTKLIRQTRRFERWVDLKIRNLDEPAED